MNTADKTDIGAGLVVFSFSRQALAERKLIIMFTLRHGELKYNCSRESTKVYINIFALYYFNVCVLCCVSCMFS